MPGPGGVWSAASWTWRVPPKKVSPNAQNPTKIGPKNPQNGPKMSILTIIPSLATFPPKPTIGALRFCILAFAFFSVQPDHPSGPQLSADPGAGWKKVQAGSPLAQENSCPPRPMSGKHTGTHKESERPTGSSITATECVRI